MTTDINMGRDSNKNELWEVFQVHWNSFGLLFCMWDGIDLTISTWYNVQTIEDIIVLHFLPAHIFTFAEVKKCLSLFVSFAVCLGRQSSACLFLSSYLRHERVFQLYFSEEDCL